MVAAQSNHAYSAIAPFYDDFTASYEYDAYTATTERLARRHGVEGNRLLDVACGTGKSLMPPLERGWVVEGCDSSPDMLALARAKTAGRAELVMADMRSLPNGEPADFITSLDDSLNYLLGGLADLHAVFTGFRRRLGRGGVVLFDVNTRRTYVDGFCSDWQRQGDLATFRCQGSSRDAFNATGRASVHVTAHLPDGSERFLGVHRQRHYSSVDICAAATAAHLRVVGVHGLHLDGSVDDDLDEDLHTKAIYIAVANWS